MYERSLRRSGRSVLALFDPRMQQQAEGHVWTAAMPGAGVLHTRTGPHGRRTQLAAWTAQQCLLGGARLPAACGSVAFRDGCPANNLARNLELVPKPGGLHSFQLFMAGVARKQGEAGQAPLLLPACVSDEEGGDAGASTAAVRAAEAAARLALQQLYGVAGAERGRAYLSALHEEYLAAWQQEFPSVSTAQS